MNIATFENTFGVNSIIDANEELVTLTTASRRGSGYLVRLRFHADGDLYSGWQTATQMVPAQAFDEDSLAVLDEFVEDYPNFVRRPNGQLASKDEGGNSYTLRVIAGKLKVNTIEARTNPSTGEVITAPGSFSHGVLSLARMGAAPKAAGFDPDFGAVPAARRRRAIATA